MKNWVINKYLISEFLKSFFNVALVFAGLGLLMNLFEEINFFGKYEVGITLPLKLSFMIVPSILINMLPFVLFLSSMWTLLKLKNNRDVLSLRTFGFSNVTFLNLFSFTAFFIGIITLLAVNPITSVAAKYYEDIKGKYDLDKSHLASITSNGIWIKEKMNEDIHFIKSIEFNDDFLDGVSVYKFDKNNFLFERIEAKRADINNTDWIMEDVRVTNFSKDNVISKQFEQMTFYSNFNKAKLNSIYSNLDTISFYKLITQSNDLVDKGYNYKLLEEKKHFYLSLPFFLVLMVLLSGIFTLNTNDRRENVYYVMLSIITCVVIFYFKNFSAALGTTERIPIILSVWSPVLILFLFCSIGIMQINEK